MKKLYIAPSSKVFNVDLTSIIAASGNIPFGGSSTTPGAPTEADVKEDKDWNIWEE